MRCTASTGHPRSLICSPAASPPKPSSLTSRLLRAHPLVPIPAPTPLAPPPFLLEPPPSLLISTLNTCKFPMITPSSRPRLSSLRSANLVCDGQRVDTAKSPPGTRALRPPSPAMCVTVCVLCVYRASSLDDGPSLWGTYILSGLIFSVLHSINIAVS